ncbi:toxin-antitoxin system HicB family antitoxin [Terriglobus sp. RCC_193]|uniref:toxin-antitoxin system HicB family antitoxin n=1 Tax=Terriglobus sp. RCC_193 TaxID=3239218 RepID=UPI0035250057
MNHRTYPLRLSPSMREQVERLAKKDQVSLNHFICLALAEKLSRMEHQAWMGMDASQSSRHPPHNSGTFAA